MPSDEEDISKQQQNVDVAVEKKNQTKTNTTSSKPKSSQNKENNSEEKENKSKEKENKSKEKESKSKEKEQKPKAKKETKPKKEPQNVDLSKKKVFCEKYFFFFDLDCFVAINVVVIM